MEPASAEPPIAVAIVSWNTRELLERCLEAFRPEADSGLARVWVVDNASDDGSAAMVRDRFAWVRLIASPENVGYGPAVNLVAGRTTSDWIVVGNADVRPLPGAIEALVATASGDDRIGIVAPRLIQPDGTTQYSTHPFPTLANTLMFNVGLGRLASNESLRATLPGTWDPERASTPDWAHGALLLVRRRAWNEIGGFDPRQWLYAEDLDLGWRMRRAGWLTRYDPAALVEHEVSASAKAAIWGDVRDRRAQRATYAWMLEHLGPAQTRLSAIVNIAGAAARWLGATLATPVRGRRYGERRELYRRAVVAHLTGLTPRGRLLSEREP
jgi:N-acetylglucosaminyl-diphospho-decaprenol L-rhamnosyltransferase